MVSRVRRVQVGAVTLAVTEAGPSDGPPVLLLHGFPDRADVWRHQVDALAAAGHRVMAPDLRGFGDSDRPDGVEHYGVALLVADLAGLLDDLGVERTAVVGHDWGAVLGWAFTAAHPDRVERLAVVSVGHPAARAGAGLAQQVRGAYILVFLVPGLAERLLPLGRWWWLRRAWGGASLAGTPDLARQVADLSRPGALSAGLAWYRANIPLPRLRLPGRRRRPALPSLPGSSDGRWRRVSCPVMGVWSSDDPVLTEAQMTGTARHVDGPWRYERLDGVGHWVPVLAPERLTALLLDFLA